MIFCIELQCSANHNFQFQTISEHQYIEYKVSQYMSFKGDLRSERYAEISDSIKTW